MAVYTKEVLSGSTDGKPILVTASSTPGTTIHDAHASATDEVWLWACNTSASDVKLTIENGGTTAGFLCEVTIPAESGYIPIFEGLIATNSTNIDAFAGTGSVINIAGFVNRIT